MTDRTADRIRLAEWLGACPSDHNVSHTWTEWGKCPLCGVRMEDASVFDPFTNANDDYVILEWMRKPENQPRTVSAECEIEAQGWAWRYKIGDYAEAALKVIGERDDTD